MHVLSYHYFLNTGFLILTPRVKFDAMSPNSYEVFIHNLYNVSPISLSRVVLCLKHEYDLPSHLRRMSFRMFHTIVVGVSSRTSIFITTLSGFFGMGIGIIILNSLDSGTLQEYFITRAGVDFGIAFFATIILIVFGVIAGYVPAKRAASIKPIEALRDE